MDISRRNFLKASGATLSGLFLFNGVDTNAVMARSLKKVPLKKKVKESTTICCYCSVGCGAIVSVYEDGILKIEGDPDHPINEGTLCPKGLAMSQIHQVDGKPNPHRLTKPLYRAPNSTEWEEKSWDWMLDTIAARVKATRDASWVESAGRTEGLASFGGGELDNEECYLLSKMNRALGVVYLENCARI
ncbi:MAG: twin-arginine translocation signal domain-containing protein [Dehalococcoidales bacterium]|nr:twin-arginine translocation signal domain-containing protein [Dehalococcoidales bacterium]